MIFAGLKGIKYSKINKRTAIIMEEVGEVARIMSCISKPPGIRHLVPGTNQIFISFKSMQKYS